MRAALDAAGIAGVVVEHRLVRLVAGDAHLGGVDHDDVVAAIDMRGELRLVLAAQAVGDDDGEAAEHDALGVDQHPVLLHLRRFQRGVVFSIAMGSVRSGGGVWSETPMRSRVSACGIMLPQNTVDAWRGTSPRFVCPGMQVSLRAKRSNPLRAVARLLRHYVANATKARHPRESGDRSGLGPRFRGDDGVACVACGPSGVCYIMPDPSRGIASLRSQ